MLNVGKNLIDAHLQGERGAFIWARLVSVEPILMDFRTDNYLYDTKGNIAGWDEIRSWKMKITNTRLLPVDVEITQRANILRTETPSRLPTIDGLIAATAAVHGCTLVHRDVHLAEIPSDLVDQLRLPSK